MTIFLVHIRSKHINLQEENLIYTRRYNRHLASLMRSGPGRRTFPAAITERERGGRRGLSVSDMLLGRLVFIPEGGS